MSHPLVVNVKTEACDVYVGRPSKYGNPFKISRMLTRREVIEKYREYLVDHPTLADDAKRELRGKVLGCYCAPLDCHADVLAELANA